MSGEVKRLDYCDQGLADDPDGDFVLYSDYADLLARYEAVIAAGRNLVAWTASGNDVPIDLPFVFRERWQKIVADIRALDRAMQDDGDKP